MCNLKKKTPKKHEKTTWGLRCVMCPYPYLCLGFRPSPISQGKWNSCSSPFPRAPLRLLSPRATLTPAQCSKLTTLPFNRVDLHAWRSIESH